MNPVTIVLAIVALAAGVAAGYKLFAWRMQKSGAGENEAAKLLEEARNDAERIRREAQEKSTELGQITRRKAEEEHEALREKLAQQQKELTRREEALKKEQSKIQSQRNEIQKQERSVVQKEQAAETMAKAAEKAMAQAQEHLQRLAGMTVEQARQMLEEQIKDEARAAAAGEIKKIEEQTRLESERRSKQIIVDAIQRHAGEYVSERTVSVVQLPSDEMKGRIIGREGRNIRTLEAATGVDLVIDDTPEAVIISCFNPVRREVARLALTRLIADGRIHPTRIEEMVAKCEAEVEAQCKEAGEQAVFDLGLYKIHPELVRLLGTLKYRSSYSQNLLRHSVEVGYLAGLMASELSLNLKLARRAGLLHDIGKAADQSAEGSHAVVGADLARKFGESPKIVHAIIAHHGEVEVESPLDVLIQAANTLSSKRPGARKDQLESYIRRIESLEKLCTGFNGVRRAFAIQAGREVRIMVENEKVSDEVALLLSQEIASKIETELSYPGQIKVNVIRESRFADFAK